MVGTKKSNIPPGLYIRYLLAHYWLYPLVYYIFRYRRRIVHKNIQGSFPELTEHQIIEKERQFYRYFCDMIAEVSYSKHMSEIDFEQHIHVRNLSLLLDCSREHGGSILMMAHIGNWEWLATIAQRMREGELEAAIAYRRQKNKWINALMYRLRKRCGGILIDKNRLLREMLALQKTGKRISYVLISDQKPRPEVTRVYTNFLNRNTGFLDGGEVLSRKFDYPVFYAHVSMPAKGQYEVDFRLITDQPQLTSPSEITCAYAKSVEDNIKEQPALWLWSHNRWKWSK